VVDVFNLTEEWLARLRSSFARSASEADDFNYVNLGDSIATGVIGINGKSQHYAAVAAQLVAERLGLSARRGLRTPDDLGADAPMTLGGHGWRIESGGLYGGGCFQLDADDAVLHVLPQPLSRAVRIAHRGALEYSTDRGGSWHPVNTRSGHALSRSEIHLTGCQVWFRGRGRIMWLQDRPAAPGIAWYTSGVGATRIGDLERRLAEDRDTGYRAYGVLAPDLLTIEIGVNDTIHADEENPTNSANALRRVLAGLRAHGSQSLALIGAPPVRLDYQPGTWRVVDAYREIYRPVAGEFGIPLLECLTRWSNYDRAFARGFLTDQVHPSALGHADLAAGVADLLLSATSDRRS